MPEAYNPNSEATNKEKVIAGHWELLRRNKEFRSVSKLWLASEKFRRKHALGPVYCDMQNHTPRCAWDWMLTAKERVRLARYQIETWAWLLDREFNFGPIVCRQNFAAAAVTRQNLRSFVRVEPMRYAPPPLTVSQSWDCTPDEFKRQFQRAYSSAYEFGEINSRLAEIGKLLRIMSKKLDADDPLKEIPVIASFLCEFGSELRNTAEFWKVFKIPRSRVSEKQFKLFLGQINDAFKVDGLLVPTKKYDTHKSYQGTDEDWRWFLMAESRGLDIRKSADARKLAEIYSEDLRQRKMRGKAPRRAVAHGHTGTKFSSRVIKNRRSTVKRHVLAVEKWIRSAYPRRKPDPGSASS
jgi:hypothetical protein